MSTPAAPSEAHFEQMVSGLMDQSRLTPMHWKIWWLSAMGVMLDGFDLFIIGIAMPLIIRQFGASPEMVGLIGAAAVLGAVLGASLGGVLTDRWGRKAIFMIDLGIFILFSMACAFAWDVWSLVVFRFMLGVGIGADYPICGSYVSSFMPKAIRGRMLIGAFSFQAVGMLMAALVGLGILAVFPQDDAWRWMLASGAVPALIILFLRASVPESVRWCMANGDHKQALKIMQGLFPKSHEELAAAAKLASPEKQTKSRRVRPKESGYGVLFTRPYLRRTCLAAGAWFLMDVATYGVGLFTPVILGAMAFSGQGLDVIRQDFKSTEGAAFLDLFLVVGFLINIWLVEKWGRIRLQSVGFIGMAAGLLLLALACRWEPAPLALVLTGFILFNLLMNIGPNSTTFILPAELYPTHLRATGHGFAAACAKAGAALGIFLLPMMKSGWGIQWTLIVLAGVCLLGFWLTWRFGVETRGRSLDNIPLH